MMVLHSYMLNPRTFFEDCIRSARMNLWSSGFPFEILDQCIDSQTLEYSPGIEAERYFCDKISSTSWDNTSWDNLLDPLDTILECPKCGDLVSVPWTAGKVNESLDKMFEDFYGFADKSFRATCSRCLFVINHEKLKVAKFREDVKALCDKRIPMPGTLYNIFGVPEVPSSARLNKELFPNRLVKTIDSRLLYITDAQFGVCQSITDLRKELTKALVDGNTLCKAKGEVSFSMLVLEEKRAFRRMMSHYSDNSSPFGIDLVGAVIRQGTFVQKMDTIDWLHSPAINTTMTRLIRKYAIFFRIMAKNVDKHMAVPTLDVDLAWHTHQLSPKRYYSFSTNITKNLGRVKVFVDHDDKVGELALEDGFEWTAKQYTKETGGEIYSECTCWYCKKFKSHASIKENRRKKKKKKLTNRAGEAVRAPQYFGPGFLRSSTVNRVRENIATLHDRPDISSDPEKNPHISAHNAISNSKESARELKTARLRSNFEKAYRRASKRRNSKTDNRNMDEKSKDKDDHCMYYGVLPMWGYPVPVPDYAPFMCDPGVHKDAYAENPVCSSSSFDRGGIFSCAGGSCGGGTCAGGSGDAYIAAHNPGLYTMGGPYIAFGGACGGGFGGGGESSLCLFPSLILLLLLLSLSLSLSLSFFFFFFWFMV